MRRTWIASALAGCALAGLTWAFLPARTTGAGQDADPAPAAKAPESPLPVKQVVLFNSGVGYMQREGTVDGDAKVDLTFSAHDVNDLLKSLILQDLGGGKVGVVSYDSHDPIEKTLRSFAIDLNDNPTFGQILNQVRGEKMELVLTPKKDKQLEKVVGIIVGMESKKRPVAKDTAVDEEIVNLSGPTGLQSIPLSDVQGVKFLNPKLDAEFRRALSVLASTHDLQKKTVSLQFNGAGKRAVRVGYISERPIWKTTYRLRIDPNGKIALQGWALVENTSDDDWNDVRMVLVSGRPISFRMNLYEPLYVPRPLVEMEMYAALRPIYSQGGPPETQPIPQAGAMQNGQAQGGQFGQFGQFGNNASNPFGNAANIREQQRMQQEFLSNNSKITYEQLQKRREDLKEIAEEAKKAGPAIAMNFKEGIDSVATGESAGDYYQYVIDQRITLARQKSAMLPILDHTIEGAKLSIYNEAVHSRNPLLGLRLKNTAGQPLTQGPITVYDAGAYAGDSRVLDLQPGESRLISYALDQGTEVKTTVKETPSPDMKLTLGESRLSASYRVRQTKTYTIRNRSPQDRTLVIEHPIRNGWTLLDTQKPADKSRSFYRFEVQAPSGKTTRFEVVEEEPRNAQHPLAYGRFESVPQLGVTIKTIVHTDEPKLESVKIEKGALTAKHRTRESTTYVIQNLTDMDRVFSVDHIVRKGWTRIDGKQTQDGPDVYHFALTVAKDKSAQKEVVEEKVEASKEILVRSLPEIDVRRYLANAAVSAEVKAALAKSDAISAKVSEAQKSVTTLEKQLKILSEDQSRLRANLQIIPMNSDHYKKFLEKFVAQETEIETLQRQVRLAQATLDSLRREQDLYLQELKAD
ncbi:MAG: hypothetical protein K2X38_08540 [Gemmataceae bacterium]|nr:hypothetical protein [Gemmataceae bacterium]